MGATPTGFEPAISALTGQYVKPLHHGAASRGEAKRLQQIVVGLPTCGQASPLHRDERPGVRDPYRFDYGNGVSTRRSGSRAPKYYVFTTSNSVDRIPVILRGRASIPHAKAVGGVTRCVCKIPQTGRPARSCFRSNHYCRSGKSRAQIRRHPSQRGVLVHRPSRGMPPGWIHALASSGGYLRAGYRWSARRPCKAAYLCKRKRSCGHVPLYPIPRDG